jgi:predicted nuclease of predicted toxin-antitoxin system
MRFLTDQDVYAGTVQLLRGLEHDVATAAELGLAQASDTDLLQTATARGRIFVTRDRDYGNLVFVQAVGTGVVYLRILPSTLPAVHAELERVLSLYSEAELLQSFIVVEPGRHRLRKLTGSSGTPDGGQPRVTDLSQPANPLAPKETP